MYNKLEEIIKSIKGNVLVIGLDDILLSKFDKNNKVNLYSIESNRSSSQISKSKKRKTNKGKTINIKKLRKYINEKSVDVLICNMNEMIDYYKYFIKDSIFLNNNIIYIYATNDIDQGFLIKRYKRYNVKIDITNYKTGYIITINNKLGKNNVFKDKLYFIKDTLYNLSDLISNILIN